MEEVIDKAERKIEMSLSSSFRLPLHAHVRVPVCVSVSLIFEIIRRKWKTLSMPS